MMTNTLRELTLSLVLIVAAVAIALPDVVQAAGIGPCPSGHSNEGDPTKTCMIDLDGGAILVQCGTDGPECSEGETTGCCAEQNGQGETVGGECICVPKTTGGGEGPIEDSVPDVSD